MREHIYIFDEEYNKERPVASYDVGIMEVPLEKIVGSVGRYRDFDRSFNILRLDLDERGSKIAEAFKTKRELPPIELYKLKEKYFILDGHHRVLIARRMGIKILKARVIEYLPPKNSIENIIARERSEFELMTGLKGIVLTEISQYEKLMNQIREHKYYMSERVGREVTYKEAAMDWYETIYRPIAARISQEGIHKEFPGREIADLYVYISDHKWMESQRRGYDIGFATALREFHETKCDRTFKDIVRDFFTTLWKTSHQKKEFEELTGLRNIDLSDDKSYPLLLKQIEEHKYYLSQKSGKEVSLKEASFKWLHDVFNPIRRILEEERYTGGFPRKTSADLYLMLSELKWIESEKRGFDIGFEGAFKELRKKKEEMRGKLREKIKRLLRKLQAHVIEDCDDNFLLMD